MFGLSSTPRPESLARPATVAGEPALGDGRLLPAPMFRHALCLERKRAERSGHFFVLMLVNTGRTDEHRHGADATGAMVTAILSSVRATDIAGWHVARRVLGVIFTELGDHERQLAVAALRARVTA